MILLYFHKSIKYSFFIFILLFFLLSYFLLFYFLSILLLYNSLGSTVVT